jgi:hypothetical protein
MPTYNARGVPTYFQAAKNSAVQTTLLNYMKLHVRSPVRAASQHITLFSVTSDFNSFTNKLSQIVA